MIRNTGIATTANAIASTSKSSSQNFPRWESRFGLRTLIGFSQAESSSASAVTISSISSSLGFLNGLFILRKQTKGKVRDNKQHSIRESSSRRDRNHA